MFVVLYSKYSEKCNQLLPHLNQNFIKICVDNKKTRKFVSNYISGVPCLFVQNNQQMYRYDGINDIINFLHSLDQSQSQSESQPMQDHETFVEMPHTTPLQPQGSSPDPLQQEITAMSGRGASTMSLAQQMAAEREQEERERTPI